ncbi:MAG: OmpH family outer membrane protein, partial [Alistipes sp.]|nr:OmpH family outer membrane protein [Alistipes sp.]
MKKVLKLTLAVVCVMFSTSLFAQKIGRINSQEVVVNMTEFKEAQTQIEALAKDLSAQAETLQVEFNTKF